MIDSIKLAGLRNTELLQFNDDALSIVSTNNPAALQITNQYNALKTINGDLKTLYITDRSSPITEELLAMDLRRDNAVNGIIAIALGATYHFNNANKTAATGLTNYFGTYGSGIARENYPSETAIITNIVSDLANKPNLAAAIATLQLGDWVLEMDTANQVFNKQYLARTKEYGAASLDTMKAKRLEAANSFYVLRNKLDAYFTINDGAEPFATATNQLNALIAQYNTLLAGRIGTTTVTPAATAAPEVIVTAS